MLHVVLCGFMYLQMSKIGYVDYSMCISKSGHNMYVQKLTSAIFIICRQYSHLKMVSCPILSRCTLSKYWTIKYSYCTVSPEEIHFHHHYQAHLIHHFDQCQITLSTHMIQCKIQIRQRYFDKAGQTQLTWTKCEPNNLTHAVSTLLIATINLAIKLRQIATQ